MWERTLISLRRWGVWVLAPTLNLARLPLPLRPSPTYLARLEGLNTYIYGGAQAHKHFVVKLYGVISLKLNVIVLLLMSSFQGTLANNSPDGPFSLVMRDFFFLPVKNRRPENAKRFIESHKLTEKPAFGCRSLLQQTWNRPALGFVAASETLQDWRTRLLSSKPVWIWKWWRDGAWVPGSFTGSWAGGPWSSRNKTGQNDDAGSLIKPALSSTISSL